MTEAELAYPEPPGELAQALQLYSPIPATFRVLTGSDYTTAGEILKDRLRMRKLIIDFFAPLKKAAHDAHKKLTAAEKEKLDPIATDEVYLKRAMALWKIQQDALVAKERAEKEAQLRREAEDRQLEEAARLEKLGQTSAALATLDAPVMVPMPPPAQSTPDVDGISYRTLWRAEVTDFRAMLAFVASNPDAYAHLVQPDESAIAKFAAQTKGSVLIPGVRVYSEVSVAGRV